MPVASDTAPVTWEPDKLLALALSRPSEALAAARDVQGAALDFEADWTPALRAALAAVIEATGTGER